MVHAFLGVVVGTPIVLVLAQPDIVGSIGGYFEGPGHEIAVVYRDENQKQHECAEFLRTAVSKKRLAVSCKGTSLDSL